MSCYLRHMKDVLNEAGIEVTKQNKKDIDRIIHKIVGVEYKNCSPAWKAVKEEIKNDENKKRSFIKKLKSELKAA
jgi:molecular chaperone GrpE (heat shock protein)